MENMENLLVIVKLVKMKCQLLIVFMYRHKSGNVSLMFNNLSYRDNMSIFVYLKNQLYLQMYLVFIIWCSISMRENRTCKILKELVLQFIFTVYGQVYICLKNKRTTANSEENYSFQRNSDHGIKDNGNNLIGSICLSQYVVMGN